MNQDWFEFINARMETEREQYGKTEEYRHRRVIEIQQEEMLETNLTKDEKLMVDDGLCWRIEEIGGYRIIVEQGFRFGNPCFLI